MNVGAESRSVPETHHFGWSPVRERPHKLCLENGAFHAPYGYGSPAFFRVVGVQPSGCEGKLELSSFPRFAWERTIRTLRVRVSGRDPARREAAMARDRYRVYEADHP